MYNMKRRRGFTLIEAVITIGIMGICFGLITLVMVSLVRVQDASADENLVNSDLRILDEVVSKYTSTISLKNDSFNFEYDSCSENSLKFKWEKDAETIYKFSLDYSSPNIVISSDYDGEIEYLQIAENRKIESLSNVTFAFDEDIKLLVVNAEARGINNKFVYTMRVS